jgi:4-amino-4-deoxy-L-arabinose transferase-like glycosyltransferase
MEGIVEDRKMPHGESRLLAETETVNRTRHILLVVAVFLGAALLYFSALDKTPLRVNAEIRCHDVIMGMIATGDYLIPVFDGEPRFNKPPLFYWTAALTSQLLGGFDLYTLRLPSVLAAFGVLGIVLLWGRELKSPRESLLALALLTPSYLFITQARQGSFEMLLTVLSSACLLLCFRLARNPNWLEGVAAALLFGLAFLAKATPAFLLVGAVILVWLLAMRQARRILSWQVMVLLAATLTISFSWHACMLAWRPDSREPLTEQLMLPFGYHVDTEPTAEHREPPWFYLKEIWRSAFPISAFLPVLALYFHRRRSSPADSAWRLLGIATFLPLAVFSMIPMKQDHYLLPLLPPLALLEARAILWALNCSSAPLRLWVSIPVYVLACIMIAGAVVAPPALWLVGDWPPLAAGTVGIAPGLLAVAQIIAARRNQWLRSAVFGAAAIALFFWVYIAVLRPVEDAFGSGTMYSMPGYNASAWEMKFERFPYLRKVLDVDRGLRRLQQGR